MKKHPLWPLLPPVAVLGMMFLFINLTQGLSGSVTECGIQKFTGLHCPGCGGTRCAQEIASGHWLPAMSHNAMLMIGFLLLMAGSLYLIVRITILGKPAPRFPNIKTRWIWLGVAGIVLFTIFRNIPAFSYLAP